MFATIYRLTLTATSGEEVLERGDLIRIALLYLDITPELSRETLRNWRCNPNYLWAIKQVLDAIEFGDIDDAREKLRLSSA